MVGLLERANDLQKVAGDYSKGSGGHLRLFVQSFLHMPMERLLGEIGMERFIAIWPEVRKGLSTGSPIEKTVIEAWDAVCGVIAAGC